MTGDQLVTVEFSPPGGHASKREIVLHPEQLAVQFDLENGEVTTLTLVRQRDLDLSEIPVYVDGVKWQDNSVKNKVSRLGLQ